MISQRWVPLVYIIIISVSRFCCNKLTQIQWLKTTLILLKFWRSELWNQFFGITSRCWQGLLPFGDSRGESIFLPFSASGGYPYFLTLWPLSPSSKCIPPRYVLPSSHRLFLFRSQISLYLCLLRTFVITFRVHPKNLGYLPISRSFSWLHLQYKICKNFLSCSIK